MVYHNAISILHMLIGQFPWLWVDHWKNNEELGSQFAIDSETGLLNIKSNIITGNLIFQTTCKTKISRQRKWDIIFECSIYKCELSWNVPISCLFSINMACIVCELVYSYFFKVISTNHLFKKQKHDMLQFYIVSHTFCPLLEIKKKCEKCVNHSVSPE